jgi:predicted hydrolase (HD superfamily)
VARRKQPCDMDTVSAYRVAAQYLTARALLVEMPYNLALTHMTDDQLICCVAADAAEYRLAHERNWTASPVSQYGNLVADLEKGLTKDNKEAKQQMIAQLLRIEIAQYRALALIANNAHWQTISEEATWILTSTTETLL